ncbi:hypothetical protein E4U19_006040 [Claviceps sp. Clav32 group G5]|nr:hypothetical protein E4U19_006040 [Claviceps sp. Clav32 group G5]
MSRLDTATSGIAIVQLVVPMASPHLDPPNGLFTEHPDSHQWQSPEITLDAYRRWDLERYRNTLLRRLGVPRGFPTQMGATLSSLALDVLSIPAKTADYESAFNAAD